MNTSFLTFFDIQKKSTQMKHTQNLSWNQERALWK